MTEATVTDPTYAALLAGVLRGPAEDAPRLVLADWLQENGDELWAEFIRVQIAISIELTGRLWPRGIGVGPIYDRERQLLSVIHDVTRDKWRDGNGELWWEAWRFRRGFVESITCTAAAWLTHCDRSVVVGQPITQVTLTTKPDVLQRGNWYFLHGDPRHEKIPLAVVDAIYPPDTLNHVCLRYLFQGIQFDLVEL